MDDCGDKLAEIKTELSEHHIWLNKHQLPLEGATGDHEQQKAAAAVSFISKYDVTVKRRKNRMSTSSGGGGDEADDDVISDKSSVHYGEAVKELKVREQRDSLVGRLCH